MTVPVPIQVAIERGLCKYYSKTVTNEVEMGASDLVRFGEEKEDYSKMRTFLIDFGALNPAGVTENFMVIIWGAEVERMEIPWLHSAVDDPKPLQAILDPTDTLNLRFDNDTTDDQTYDVTLSSVIFKEDALWKKYQELVEEGV